MCSNRLSIKKICRSLLFKCPNFYQCVIWKIQPPWVVTSLIASLEAYCGCCLLLWTLLFYGRGFKAKAFLYFIHITIIAPFKKGKAVISRTVPYKNNHLTQIEVKLTLAIRTDRNGETRNEFYHLKLEYNKITALVLNWTIVHPNNEERPYWNPLGP